MELTRQAHAGGEEVGLAAVIDPRSDIGQGAARRYVGRAWSTFAPERFRLGRSSKAPRLARSRAAGVFPIPISFVDPLRPDDSHLLRRRYRLTASRAR